MINDKCKEKEKSDFRKDKGLKKRWTARLHRVLSLTTMLSTPDVLQNRYLLSGFLFHVLSDEIVQIEFFAGQLFQTLHNSQAATDAII